MGAGKKKNKRSLKMSESKRDPVDVSIKKVKRKIANSRMVRVATGKATSWELFWFMKGFGRGKYAIGRLIVLLLTLGILYPLKLIKKMFK